MPSMARLSDYPNISEASTAAFKGSWLCSDVTTVQIQNADCCNVACFRFLPKLENATEIDPRFAAEKLKVTTFIEGQSYDKGQLESVSQKLLKNGDDLIASYKDTVRSSVHRMDYEVDLALAGAISQVLSASALTLAASLLMF